MATSFVVNSLSIKIYPISIFLIEINCSHSQYRFFHPENAQDNHNTVLPRTYGAVGISTAMSFY
jgi:hypothetical protein